MFYRIYYGELSEQRKQKWENEDENPYQILAWTKEIDVIDWISFLGSARKHFTDEIQVDWGSFAWKATKESLCAFQKASKAKIKDLHLLEDNVVYGVVFIEEN